MAGKHSETMAGKVWCSEILVCRQKCEAVVQAGVR